MSKKQISLEFVVAIGKDVVSCDLEGEAVILNLASGIYLGLNEVGTRIWSLIQEYGALREVFGVMQQEYEVAPKELEIDILQLVDQLHANGLVSLVQPQERGKG